MRPPPLAKPPANGCLRCSSWPPQSELATAAISSPHPASADQISDAKAQAAAITAKIQATEAQIAALTGQVKSADYQLSQLNSQIAANQAEMHQGPGRGGRRTRASSAPRPSADYTSSGTTNQVTQMFSSNPNTSDIRSEYSSIATGNVTTTIDNLHTAQSQLQATQSALQQQQSQQTATRNSLQASESQATALANQDQATLNSVNANIQNLVPSSRRPRPQRPRPPPRPRSTPSWPPPSGPSPPPRQLAASGISAGGVTTAAPSGPPPPVASGAAGAVQAAESQVGVPYVWGGDTPAGFDCSGLVMWAYAQAGVGLPRTSGAQYAATTHIALADIEPGDLLFYGPGGSRARGHVRRRGLDDRGALHRGLGLDHRRAHRRRIRRCRPGRLTTQRRPTPSPTSASDRPLRPLRTTSRSFGDQRRSWPVVDQPWSWAARLPGGAVRRLPPARGPGGRPKRNANASRPAWITMASPLASPDRHSTTASATDRRGDEGEPALLQHLAGRRRRAVCRRCSGTPR